MSYEKQSIVDLEWGDGDGENEERVSENGNEERVSENKNGEDIDIADGVDEEICDTGVREEEDNSNKGEERVREIRQSRERQPPTWIGDYVSGEGLYEDKVHMALVVSTYPLFF